MTKYPNREALRKAHDIYRDAMREFIYQYLEKRVKGETVNDLITRVLGREQHGPVDIKDISIKDISVIFRRNSECWNKFFSQQFGYDQQFGQHEYDITSVTALIVMGRNKVSHPGSRDLDPDYTNTHLFLITEVLGKIGKKQAKYEVQDIWDDLCSDDTEEHPTETENADLKERLAEMSAQLEMLKTEKAEYGEELKRLEEEKTEYAELLETVETEKIEIEKQLGTAPTRLNEMKAANTGLKKQLLETENRLKVVELESDEHIKTLTEQLADSEECFKNSQKQLKTTNVVKTKLEKRLGTMSTRLENVEAELDDRKKDLASALRQVDKAKPEQTEYLSAEERLARALTESEIEEAEEAEYKEDFRVTLPTGKEMEQPVLEFLADRKEHRRIEIIDWLTEYFSLTDDERSYLSKSGQAEKHLMNKNLIERTRTGYYRITVDGLEGLRRDETDKDSVFSNEVYTESQSYSESPTKSPKSQRKWRRPGAVAALRDAAEIQEAEAKIARILNPSEKARLERELRQAK